MSVPAPGMLAGWQLLQALASAAALVGSCTVWVAQQRSQLGARNSRTVNSWEQLGWGAQRVVQ